MKYLLFFFIGFVLALALFALYNLPALQKRRRKRKQELKEHPERKGGTTKVLLFSILVTCVPTANAAGICWRRDGCGGCFLLLESKSRKLAEN